MKQDGLGGLEAWYPEISRDLRRLEHFLALTDRSLESRRDRLQKALGAQHFVISQEMSGLLLLVGSGIWLAILPIASSIFHVATEGIHLSQHPSRVDDFIEYGWYESYRDARPLRGIASFTELMGRIRNDQERKFENLRSNYWSKTTWHEEGVETLAEMAGTAYLLPIYRSINRLAEHVPRVVESTGRRLG